MSNLHACMNAFTPHFLRCLSRPMLTCINWLNDKGPALPDRRPPFEALVRTVVGQQLSVKAASTISARLTSACHGQLEPSRIQGLSMEALRGAGLSQSKADCVLRVADMAGPGGLHLERLIQMPSSEWRKEALADQGAGALELRHVWDVWPWRPRHVLCWRLGTSERHGDPPLDERQRKARSV